MVIFYSLLQTGALLSSSLTINRGRGGLSWSFFCLHSLYTSRIGESLECNKERKAGEWEETGNFTGIDHTSSFDPVLQPPAII